MRRTLIAVRRRAQTAVLRAVRRSPIFPATVPDRQGDDDRLRDTVLDATVMIYFPGALDTLYQITPWLPTFDAVHAAHRAVVVCQDSRVAARLRQQGRAPVLTIARYGALDGLLARSDVKLVLYVSHLPRNFEALRFSSLLHAYIGHGDSDKGVSASNQLKAYDYVLAPGPAAVERIARRLMRYDPAGHCIVVGQPVTLSAPPAEAPPPGGRRHVLYAPTWEGAQPSVAYSSVRSHGLALIEALLADPEVVVLYRPHPLIGVTSGAYAVADRAIRDRITAAGSPHAVITAAAESLEATFSRAHALVTDVSAVATAWLPSLRPIVVTRATGQSVTADSGMLGVVPRLGEADTGRVAALIRETAEDRPGRAAREAMVAHYLSDYWPDRSLERFVEVVGGIAAERDRLRGELLAGGATGV